jgi:hypothetical protein
VTKSYAQRFCAAGSKVQLLELPGVGHGLAADDGASAAVDWIADRFKAERIRRRAIATGCDQVAPRFRGGWPLSAYHSRCWFFEGFCAGGPDLLPGIPGTLLWSCPTPPDCSVEFCPFGAAPDLFPGMP